VHGGILWTHFPDNYPPSQIGSRVTVSASFQNIACLVDQLGQKYELVRVLTFSLGGNLRGGGIFPGVYLRDSLHVCCSPSVRVLAHIEVMGTEEVWEYWGKPYVIQVVWLLCKRRKRQKLEVLTHMIHM